MRCRSDRESNRRVADQLGRGEDERAVFADAGDDLVGGLVHHELGAVEQVDQHVVMVFDPLDVIGVHVERISLSESGEANHRFPRE